MVCVFIGFFYPIYYLQLMAIEHGLSSSFAFYSVSHLVITILLRC